MPTLPAAGMSHIFEHGIDWNQLRLDPNPPDPGITL